MSREESKAVKPGRTRYYQAARSPQHALDWPALMARLAAAKAERLLPAEANARAEELLAKRRGKRGLFVRNNPRLARLEAIASLLAKARELAGRDARASLATAEAALEAVKALRVPLALGRRRHDLLALAFSWRANATRALGDFQAAQFGLMRAYDELPRGSGDPLIEAWIEAHEGVLARDRGETGLGVSLLEASYTTFCELGSEADQVFVGLGLARAYEANCQIGKAYDLLTLLGPFLVNPRHNDPLYQMGILHELFRYSCEVGDGITARRFLEVLGPLYSRPGNERFDLLARWASGRLLLAEKKWARAAQLLDGVRLAFTAQGDDFEAALAGLELATAWAALGRASEVRKLALGMIEVFESAKIPAKAHEALSHFQRAADACRADQALMEKLLAQLEPVRRNPAWARRAA